jgi:putative ABC transport system permease protein
MKRLLLFFRHSLRHAWRHKVLTVLNLSGVALGVSVFTAVQLVNHAALQSFRASVDIVAGRADYRIESDGLRFSEEIYPWVRAHPLVEEATPLVEDLYLLPDHPGSYLHVMGIDLFTARGLSTYTLTGADGGRAGILDFLSDPRAVVLNRSLARRLGVAPGDELAVTVAGRPERLRVTFLMDPSADASGVDEHLVLMDIAAVQEMSGRVGQLNRIDVLLRAEAGPEGVATLTDDLRGQLPPHVRAGPPDRRGERVERMLGAFQLNLTALSMIALMVGMFLIYNTVAASVVNRRAEIGLLRALGMSGGGVQSLFIAEALVLGLAGAVLGVGAGVFLALTLLEAVSQTITSLYILVRIQEVFLDPVRAGLGVGAGLVAVVLAAWVPAREAARVDPVEALSMGTLAEKAERGTGRWSGVAAGCFLVAGLLSWLARGPGPAWLGFGAALGVLMGFAFLAPVSSRWLARVFPAWNWEVRLACDQFGRSLHRNAVAVAAVVTALAMVLGVSIMIHSFRQTVTGWLERTIAADVFVAPASNLVAGSKDVLPPEVVARVRGAVPSGGEVDLYREVRMEVAGRLVKVASCDFSVLGRRRTLEFTGALSSDPVESARLDGQLLVSESFARKTGLGPGDRVQLPLVSGWQALVVQGVFTDFTSESGLVLMDRSLYRRETGDNEVTSMAVYLPEGTEAGVFQERLRSVVAEQGEFLIYSNGELRREALAIFDQTFAITYLLRAVAVVVAGLGILLTLTLLVSERRRVIAVVRSAGASRAQVMGLVAAEAGLIACVGSGLGLAAGFALAAVLSYVINVAFFGWTIEWATPWGVVWQTPLAVLVAAVLASWWPGWKAARADIAEAVRAE